MLDVVNLSKVYKTKGGVETRALDGVTLSFPERGMVFLLGRSGSGKSTLLNVCGGLDNPSGGEIIVKGRSSKSFSQSDFDSYRNTFIGFVFQEYNILNEFSVEDNIALALELQGKPKDKKAIADLLEQVDLLGFAKRKPNTLSGGQKQRIAIARALIKNPEIIMADEPTGALDSNTGKQVFETLKKLSENKLVIVVSHDRDFAEQYGDRIIELKDGKILSDVSKAHEESVKSSDNVSVIGESTLCIGDGNALTDKDVAFIRTFLKGKKDAIIASDERDVTNFKQVSHITDDGKKEVFRDTDPNAVPKKKYKKEDSKFIRSRLPMRHAMKIGVSGLKTKPIRLLFTILLCIIAFTMFGLFSTLMLYDKDTTLYQSIQDSKIERILVKKQYQVTSHSIYDGDEHIYSYERETKLTQAEVDKYKESFGADTFGAVTLDSNISNIKSSSTVGDLYKNLKPSYIASLPQNASFTLLGTSRAPAAAGEILISEYLAKAIIKNGGFSDSQEIGEATTDLIGKKLKLNLQESQNNAKDEYLIVGVFDSKLSALESAYSQLDGSQSGGNHENDKEYQALLKQFAGEYAESMNNVAFVTEAVVKGMAEVKNKNNSWQTDPFANVKNYSQTLGVYDASSVEQYPQSSFYIKSASIPASVTTYGNKTPAAGEAVVTASFLDKCMSNSSDTWTQRDEIRMEVSNLVDNAYNTKLSGYNTDAWYTAPPSIGNAEAYSAYLCWQARSTNHMIMGNSYYVSDLIEYWLKGSVSAPTQEDEDLYEYYTQLFVPNAIGNGKLAEYQSLLPLGEHYVDLGEGATMQFSALVYALKEGEYNGTPLEETNKQMIAQALLTKLSGMSFTVKMVSSNNGPASFVGEEHTLKIVGLMDYESYESYVALNEETYNAFAAISSSFGGREESSQHYEESKYQISADAIYDVAFLPYDHSGAQTDALRMFSYEFGEDDSRVVLANAVAEQLNMVNEMVSEMGTIFMWIGIVMAVFSALLLSNFISVSISHKKKDIGILRAVGARGTDVFKIFFSESFVIALICIVFSLVASFVVCGVLNTELGSMLGASLFVFGPVSIAILIGVAVATAVIATFLPVYLAARRKPVESIRAL